MATPKALLAAYSRGLNFPRKGLGWLWKKHSIPEIFMRPPRS